MKLKGRNGIILGGVFAIIGAIASGLSLLIDYGVIQIATIPTTPLFVGGIIAFALAIVILKFCGEPE